MAIALRPIAPPLNAIAEIPATARFPSEVLDFPQGTPPAGPIRAGAVRACGIARRGMPCGAFLAMRDVAQQVRGATEELTHGSSRIRESVEGVREAVERINGALQEQSAACRSAVEFLGDVHERTRSNEDSAGRLEEMTRSLLDQAETLREDVRKFRIG